MGCLNMRVMKEKAILTTGLSGKAFENTDNSRNIALNKQLSLYNSHLGTIQQDFKNLGTASAKALASMATVMKAPAPIKTHPADASLAPTLLGPTVDTDALAHVGAEGKTALATKLFTPIQTWQQEYKLAKSQLVESETVRHELDSRRRTITALEAKLHKYSNAKKKKSQAKVDKVQGELDTQKAKAGALQTNFTSLEAEVHGKLSALVEDTSFPQRLYEAGTHSFMDVFTSAARLLSTQPGAPAYHPPLPAAASLAHDTSVQRDASGRYIEAASPTAKAGYAAAPSAAHAIRA